MGDGAASSRALKARYFRAWHMEPCLPRAVDVAKEAARVFELNGPCVFQQTSGAQGQPTCGPAYYPGRPGWAAGSGDQSGRLDNLEEQPGRPAQAAGLRRTSERATRVIVPHIRVQGTLLPLNPCLRLAPHSPMVLEALSATRAHVSTLTRPHPHALRMHPLSTHPYLHARHRLWCNPLNPKP
eukprot:350244-Chlamydomonas_euryale.AAC.2